MTGPQVAVILPTFDERENIVPLLERLARSLPPLTYEILVVDDDSPDGTAAAAEAWAAAHPGVRVIRRTTERGLRSAIQAGIDAAGADAICWMDCDLSMPPEHVPALVGALADADVATGSRYVPGGTDARADVPLHRLASRVLNLGLRALLGGGVTDYTTGFVCARRRVFEAIRLEGEYGEYCVAFLYRARRRGFRVVELGYRNTPRAAGRSKTAVSAGGLLARGWPYLATALRLRLKGAS